MRANGGNGGTKWTASATPSGDRGYERLEGGAILLSLSSNFPRENVKLGEADAREGSILTIRGDDFREIEVDIVGICRYR